MSFFQPVITVKRAAVGKTFSTSKSEGGEDQGLGGTPGTSTQSLPHQSPALACTSPGARTSAVGGPGKPGEVLPIDDKT
jgi:hypothetical protein